MGADATFQGYINIVINCEKGDADKICDMISEKIESEWEKSDYNVFEFEMDTDDETVMITLSDIGGTKGTPETHMGCFAKFIEFLNILGIYNSNIEICNTSLTFTSSPGDIYCYIVHIDGVKRLFKVAEFDKNGQLVLNIYTWYQALIEADR